MRSCGPTHHGHRGEDPPAQQLIKRRASTGRRAHDPVVLWLARTLGNRRQNQAQFPQQKASSALRLLESEPAHTSNAPSSQPSPSPLFRTTAPAAHPRRRSLRARPSERGRALIFPREIGKLGAAISWRLSDPVHFDAANDPARASPQRCCASCYTSRKVRPSNPQLGSSPTLTLLRQRAETLSSRFLALETQRPNSHNVGSDIIALRSLGTTTSTERQIAICHTSTRTFPPATGPGHGRTPPFDA